MAVRRLGRSGLACAAGLGLCVVPAAADGPEDPIIQYGSADFSFNGANTWTIYQYTDPVIVDYQSFDIESGTNVYFMQLTGPDSRFLNRIVDDPAGTHIGGRLNSNGILLTVNDGGVSIESTAVVDVGGLCLAGGAISNADFLAQFDHFTNVIGDVRNDNSGFHANYVLHLVGSRVENYGGLATDDDGVITMMSGEDVEVTCRGTGGVSAVISGDGSRGTGPGVANSGNITGGDNSVVYLGAADLWSLAIDHTGTITVGEAGRVTLHKQGGSQGDIQISGSIHAGSGSEVLIETEAGNIVNFGDIDAADSEVTFVAPVGMLSQVGSIIAGECDLSAVYIELGGDMTADSVDFNGPVMLSGSCSIIATESVEFHSEVDSQPGWPHDLSITAPAISFHADVGGAEALDALTAYGTTNLSGGLVNTIASQEYAGPVVLGADTMLAGPYVTFEGAVDGTTAGQEYLDIQGAVAFSGNVGGVCQLDSLIVSGPMQVNGEQVINTAGDQTFDGPVVVTGVSVHEGSTITFSSTLDGSSGGDQHLMITGDAVFNGGVGQMDALDSLKVVGVTFMNGGAMTTVGDQTYDGNIELGSDTALFGSVLTFEGEVAGTTSYQEELYLEGDVLFNDDVGSAVPLASISVSGTAHINCGLVDSNYQVYHGETVIGAYAILTGSIIEFHGALDGQTPGADYLVVDGDAVFNSAVGGNTLLQELRVAGTTHLNGGVVQTGFEQRYVGATTLGQDSDLLGSSVRFEGKVDGTMPGQESLYVGGDAVFAGDVGMTNALGNLMVMGTTRAAGDILAEGDVDFQGGLTLNGAGNQLIEAHAGELKVEHQLTKDIGSITLASSHLIRPMTDLTVVTGDLVFDGNVIFENSAILACVYARFIDGAAQCLEGGPGTLIISGNGAFEFDSTLEIELAGLGQHDRVELYGDAELYGRLDVQLVNGYEPQPGDEFEIITANFVDGEFSEVLGAEGAEVVYDYDRVIVRFGGPCPADMNGDSYVDIDDLFIVLGYWGYSDVPADINQDGTVDINDVFELLGAWGPCR